MSVELPAIQLIPTRVGIDGYTHADRFHDFRAVLTGDVPATEHQKGRVLYQILDEGGHWAESIANVENVNDTYLRLGKLELAQTILGWATTPRAESEEL